MSNRVRMPEGVWEGVGQSFASRHLASTATYRGAQIRRAASSQVIVQLAPESEHAAHVTPKFSAWVHGLPHPHKSVAGTGTAYAACYVRAANKWGWCHVQIEGPRLNRPWGAAVLLKMPGAYAALKKGGK